MNLFGKHERRKPQLRLYSIEHTLLPTRLLTLMHVQDDTKERELLKNPTKIEEIQEKIY